MHNNTVEQISASCSIVDIKQFSLVLKEYDCRGNQPAATNWHFSGTILLQKFLSVIDAI